MEFVDGVGAQYRWRSRQSYNARGGGRMPVFTATPSILLEEGRPFFYLPAWVPKGRHVSFCSETMASSSGELGCWRRSGGDRDDPSDFVPGVFEIESVWELYWTRLRFSFSIWGPLSKNQGLAYNFLFSLGPVVNCSVSPLYVLFSF